MPKVAMPPFTPGYFVHPVAGEDHGGTTSRHGALRVASGMGATIIERA